MIYLTITILEENSINDYNTYIIEHNIDYRSTMKVLIVVKQSSLILLVGFTLLLVWVLCNFDKINLTLK